MKNLKDETKKEIVVLKKNSKKPLRIILWSFVALIVAAGTVLLWLGNKAYRQFDGKGVRIVIPNVSSQEEVNDILISQLGNYGADIAWFWKVRGGDPHRAAGSYVINPGDRVWSVVNRIRVGAQTPVRLTFNNVRTMDELATRISRNFAFSEIDFLAACDSLLPEQGFNKAQYPAAFVPDTYEFYATATAEDVVRKLAEHREKFWNEDRRAKAKTLGLSPVEVTTVASIVEEETAKSDERGKVARLYINRLDKGMRLQADPTVKFALGDFSIKRIVGPMLKVQSRYNTYLYEGLPPGPIRIPELSTIDAVLSAPAHAYVYMCAREDFSGYHNFTSDYNEHLANARRYQAELDARGIN